MALIHVAIVCPPTFTFLPSCIWCAYHILYFYVDSLSPLRELGVHVDGFIAVVGHTTVVGATKVCVCVYASCCWRCICVLAYTYMYMCTNVLRECVFVWVFARVGFPSD